MAKIKQTRVPLPGENPKKAPKLSETARGQGQRLSEEVVVESDSGGSGNESSSGDSSDSEFDAGKRTEPEKPNPKAMHKTKPASPPVPEHTESESESASASESRHTSASASDSGSETGSESGSEDVGETASVTETQAEGNPARTAAAAAETVAFRPPPPYEPPIGFKPAKLSGISSSNSKAYQPLNLAGKQVWYITAPASVAITAIKDVSLEAVRKGKSVLQHEGIDYGFVMDASGGETARLLLPSDSDEKYRATSTQIAQTLHLQQIVRLPDLSNKQATPTTSSGAATATRKPSQGARQQPMGLKMRSLPIGFGSGKPGTLGPESDDDVTMVDATREPTLQVPKGSEATAQSKKRKHVEANGTNGINGDASRKPKKSKKGAKDNDGPARAEEDNDRSAAPLPKRDDSGGTVINRAVANGAPESHGIVAVAKADVLERRGETQEEKAKRKERRRKKKEKENSSVS
ncbi:hypothetical protein LTR16_001514 [Cryomyces antarcticus]|uniref:DNA-directed RNA polymerase I subunit RPA34.5 n=1 Tax=Cryomyces antarcticus TaxID=329879 RepID=A0ABR0LQ79_9PEZI|nr:hypothetical protein LTR16_001514 [Cryomyces antarcticus]